MLSKFKVNFGSPEPVSKTPSVPQPPTVISVRIHAIRITEKREPRKTNSSISPPTPPLIAHCITDRNRLDYFLLRQHTWLAVGALEVHGKADIRPWLVLVVLEVVRRRERGKKPAALHYWRRGLGNSTVDLMVAPDVVDNHARDRTAGIAVAENVVAAAAPCWNGRMDPNL